MIEDATEALGTRCTDGPYEGRFAGTIGDIGCYSFNGNKIITTGAGGAVVSNHADWAEHAASSPPRPRLICCSSCMMRSATTTA